MHAPHAGRGAHIRACRRGLGAATADGVYGCVAAFGLTFISGLIVSLDVWLRLVGGAFLLCLGVRILLRKATQEAAPIRGRGLLAAYASTFLLTLTNPMTIIAFAAIFASLGLAGAGRDFASAWALLSGVFIGSALWWVILSVGVGLFRGKLDHNGLRWGVNNISGAIIIAFGLFALVSAVF